jgi:integrase
LQYAYKKKLIRLNPCDFVERPKGKRYFGEFYTALEMKSLLAKTNGMLIEVPVFIAAYLGLSRSEAIGLKWSAIDFTNNILNVRQKVIRIRKEGKMANVSSGTLKTEARRRILPLDERLVSTFKAIKESQECNRQLCGDSYNNEYLEYVCVDKMGELLKPQVVSKSFAAMIKNGGFKKIRFHDLRHSCASLLLSLGYSMKDLQAWLGHANYQTTANTYCHVDHETKKKMIKGVANALDNE